MLSAVFGPAGGVDFTQASAFTVTPLTQPTPRSRAAAPTVPAGDAALRAAVLPGDAWRHDRRDFASLLAALLASPRAAFRAQLVGAVTTDANDVVIRRFFRLVRLRPDV